MQPVSVVLAVLGVVAAVVFGLTAWRQARQTKPRIVLATEATRMALPAEGKGLLLTWKGRPVADPYIVRVSIRNAGTADLTSNMSTPAGQFGCRYQAALCSAPYSAREAAEVGMGSRAARPPQSTCWRLARNCFDRRRASTSTWSRMVTLASPGHIFSRTHRSVRLKEAQGQSCSAKRSKIIKSPSSLMQLLARVWSWWRSSQWWCIYSNSLRLRACLRTRSALRRGTGHSMNCRLSRRRYLTKPRPRPGLLAWSRQRAGIDSRPHYSVA
jgi:hypothetical protein